MTMPRTLPLPMVLQSFLWIRYPVQVMNYCRKEFGPTFMVRLPRFQMVMLTEPDAIRTMFASKGDDLHAGKVNTILRAIVGSSSVLLLDGAEHMRHRKLLLPSFHGERMRFYGETMADIARQSIATWPDHDVFALHEKTQDITLQIILRTVFGVDEGTQMHKLAAQLTRLLRLGENPLFLPVMVALAQDPTLEKRMPWKWILRDRDETDALLFKQIAARRAEPESERSDVLAMLLKARDEKGQGLSDQELRDELITALVAGHETTATGLAWAFERILLHKPVYDRLKQEVRDAGGVHATPEKLAALPYLDATIKEVLRLRPVIPFVGRVLQQPMQLGGYDLPQGTAVAACIYLAQRNPDVYPDPDAFLPERFLNGQPDPASWLPFGGGIRRCIGAAFALYEMKIVMGTILAHTELALENDQPADIKRRAITFWPAGGTRLRKLSHPA
ncbi:MAG TPA: cytochrome P450 [Pseudomonadota bacterium]|nr:cytochrome P450 [Pseudomonadota bacterium]HNN52068.1 cytochrome P450 [Pseudomonadota bacterium]